LDLKYILITNWYYKDGDPDLFNEIAEVKICHGQGYSALYNENYSFYISKECCIESDSIEYLENIKYLS
jgi:hypothetical protein